MKCKSQKRNVKVKEGKQFLTGLLNELSTVKKFYSVVICWYHKPIF